MNLQEPPRDNKDMAIFDRQLAGLRQRIEVQIAKAMALRDQLLNEADADDFPFFPDQDEPTHA